MMVQNSNPDTSRQDAGFTLLELLVALALFSLLSMMLFSSLRFGLATWRTGIARADTLDQTLQIQSGLRRLLELSYPFTQSTGPGQVRIDFEGHPTSVGFLTTAPLALNSGGRIRANIFATRTDDGTGLTMTSVAELDQNAGSAATTTVKLLTNIKTMRFSYFGTSRASRATGWFDEWVNETTMPDLIRVAVTFNESDRRKWPDLVIAPRISTDVGCIFDPLTNGCRGR